MSPALPDTFEAGEAGAAPAEPRRQATGVVSFLAPAFLWTLTLLGVVLVLAEAGASVAGPMRAVLSPTLVALSLVLALAATARAGRVEIRPGHAAAVLVASLGAAAWFGLCRTGLPRTAEDILLGGALLASAAAIGLLLSRLVEKATYIIPVVLVAAAADAWSVSGGLTEFLMKNFDPATGTARGALRCLLVHVVSLDPDGGARTAPLVGAMDFIFFATFLRLADRFALPRFRSFAGLTLGGLAGLGLAAGMDVSLPLLPFIGLGFALANLHRLAPSRRELIETLLVVSVFGALALFV